MTQPQTEMVEKMALATIAPDIEELVGALREWMHIFLPTAEGGRDPLKPGWGEAIDEALDEGRAALSKFTNTKGNDRG